MAILVLLVVYATTFFFKNERLGFKNITTKTADKASLFRREQIRLVWDVSFHFISFIDES